MFFCWRKCVRVHVTVSVGVLIGIKGIISVCDCKRVGNVWNLSCYSLRLTVSAVIQVSDLSYMCKTNLITKGKKETLIS